MDHLDNDKLHKIIEASQVYSEARPSKATLSFDNTEADTEIIKAEQTGIKPIHDLINDLDKEELIELSALYWTGRGNNLEGSVKDNHAANLVQARDNTPTVDYLAGKMNLDEALVRGIERVSKIED